MAKLRIVGKENGRGIKELSVDGQQIPLSYLLGFGFEFTAFDGVLTLKYHVKDVDLVDIDNLKGVEITKAEE